ncbi:hypothetical protein B0H63DRAFT_443383 [Podospora didyma]|uniref:Telomere-associated protein 1 n=1 Tax=Podospora didyma TaxID=330526 RepID=A0AAE0U6T2_9PEZI|nr:hypothetical protein B0H63DRAFT_443383 [Podospora didyma]
MAPRLIHLLNNSQTPDLPPVRSLPSFGASGNQSLSLPPLEPDLGQRSDKSAPTQFPSLYAVGDEALAKQATRVDNAYANEAPSALSKPAHPLQLLLGDPDAHSSTLPLRMIVDATPDSSEDLSTKKRHRALTTKDDFVQLPQPLKKQKSTQQVVPPIINGLHEPPPNAAVFPPITSGSFDDDEALNLGMLKDFITGSDDRAPTAPTSDADKNNGTKVKRRATKPRRKWSDEETNHLLLGVSRHGVGKWTSILDDPDFKFNERTAGDLKDRFRTCCPDELRGQTGKKRAGKDKAGPASSTDDTPTTAPPPSTTTAAEQTERSKIQPLLENILIEPGGAAAEGGGVSPSTQSTVDLAPKQRKSRAHRKKMEDLVELGIQGPFKKSHRRERRPFTEQDDKEILEGLAQYGPAWTRIQRDPRYHLSSRQPTDLRDRVRNKYPEIYARIEKGSFQAREPGRGDHLLEPSVNTTMENALNPNISGPLEPQLNRSSSKEDMPRWPPTSTYFESSESLPGLADVFDMPEPVPTSFIATSSATEMDIGRLLLDDSQVSNEHLRYGGYDGSSNAPSPANGLPDPRLDHNR